MVYKDVKIYYPVAVIRNPEILIDMYTIKYCMQP